VENGSDSRRQRTPNPAQGLERGRVGGEERIMTYKRVGSIFLDLGRNVT
jgi:hypothetical protein